MDFTDSGFFTSRNEPLVLGRVLLLVPMFAAVDKIVSLIGQEVEVDTTSGSSGKGDILQQQTEQPIEGRNLLLNLR
jgi:hypothetical protein